MTFRSLLVVILIFFSPIVFSQNIADCIDAVAVCETTSVNYEVIGIGDVNDLPINESGCLGDGGAGTGIESNSIWFRFKAARNGQLGFNIIPDNPTDDWDFAVYGPNVSCNDLGNPVDWTGPGDCGISNYNEIIKLRKYGFKGFLIGELFMKNNNPGKEVLNLIQNII